MKWNNRGVTLIESIITIAIIAILLTALAVGMSSTIHYMGESALIKNKSNEIFEKIQNHEGQESTATMTFQNGLSVSGITKTITEKYNPEDELNLSYFNSLKADEYMSNANFYLIIDPLNVGKEETLNMNSDVYNVNKDRNNPNQNCVLNNTETSNNIEYISSRVLLPNKNNSEVSPHVNAILATSSYNNVTFNEAKIEWYKIIKKDQSTYDVYGVVKPYSLNIEIKGEIEFIFIYEPAGTTTEYHLWSNWIYPEGFVDYTLESIWAQFGLSDLTDPNVRDDRSKIMWQHRQPNSDKLLFNGLPFKLDALKDKSIFLDLNEGDKVYIYGYKVS